MTSLESLLGSSQSGVDLGEADFLRTKERTQRTQRMIGTCKGRFTNEIKKFISTADYFVNKETDLTVEQLEALGPTHLDCAEALLSSLNRVIDRYVDLEKTLDDWKQLYTEIWEGNDEDLITAIAKQDEGFAKYYKEYTYMITHTHLYTYTKCTAIRTRLVRQT